MRLALFVFIIFFQLQFIYAVEFKGKFEQGSFILGKTEPGSKVLIDNRKIRVSEQGFLLLDLIEIEKMMLQLKLKIKETFKQLIKKFLKESIIFKELMVYLQNR